MSLRLRSSLTSSTSSIRIDPNHNHNHNHNNSSVMMLKVQLSKPTTTMTLVLSSSMMLMMMMLVGLVAAAADPRYAKSTWSCSTVTQTALAPDGSIVWSQLNCTGTGPRSIDFDLVHRGGAHRGISIPIVADELRGAAALLPDWHVGPMIFNVVTANLTAPGVGVRAAATPTSVMYQLQTIPDMSANVPNSVAGINGGYFWRLDVSSFRDNVCRGKSRTEAESPVSASNPNYGVGDALLTVDGQMLANNCNCTSGYNVPVALVINGTASYVEIMSKAGKLPPQVQNAIAAGPNLVSFDGSASYINIPRNDENINIWEHAANTAAGLIAAAPGSSPLVMQTLVMVTANGHDSCFPTNPTCGITAEPMAYFMKDFIGVLDVA